MVMLSKIMLSGVLPFCHVEDDEFNMVIYELANGPVKFDEIRLRSLKFYPRIPGNSNLALSSDLDQASLILTSINLTVNIIQNTNLMNYLTKLAPLVIPFTFR